MEKYIGKQHLKRLGTGVGRSLPGLPQAKHGVRCAHQERRRGSPVISAVSWRVRRGHRQQQEQEQAQQGTLVQEPPAQPALPAGPSKLGLAALVGAVALTLATWHKLTSRGRTEGGEAAAAATGATPEEGAASIPSDMEQPTAEPGQGRTQHEERAAQVAERVEAAKLRLRAALQARQPEAAKAEVKELRALRDLAMEAFSLNSLNLEAAELRGRLADLTRAQSAQDSLAAKDDMVADAPAADGGAAAQEEPPAEEAAPEEEAEAGTSERVESEADAEQPAVAQLDASAFPAASREAAERLAQVHNAEELGPGTLEVVEDMSGVESSSAGEKPSSRAPFLEVGSVQSPPEPSGILEEPAAPLNDDAATSSSNGLPDARATDEAAEDDGSRGSMGHAAGPGVSPAAEASGDGEEAARQLQLLAGGVNLPHPAKAATGGEDAFFVTDARGGAAGVADGVSAWANEGIDAALYSRKLMRLAEEGVRRGIGSAEGAQGVLAHAARHARDVDGSSTAVVLVMRSRGGGAGDAAAAGAEIVAEVACVGDSGFRLHRGGRLVFASDVQMHSFNCPFQLASPTLWPQADTPDDADVYEVDLQPGDVLVLGSDGLFDNMWDSELELVLQQHLQAQPHRTRFTAEALARKLAAAARKNALDAHYRSPFIVEAARAGVLPLWRRVRPRGGKLDDCCVVVVFAEATELGAANGAVPLQPDAALAAASG